ncbi:ribonuclease H-like protein [Lophiostoma macrostomum CBS 122681]|uniref:ribonuclease H n=1 Tax=Lophiostoma macrostomum CBS 122681 TaxID=1314788 RepID=A0A6A6TK56_9PLEO|nr:ribonuclease H-like protein [Lophiostoma macrostomum CBS 122681]
MADAKSPSTTSGNTKRKRAAPSYYVVKAGHVPGIYYSWKDVQEQINGYEKPVYKKYTSLSEAEAFSKSDTVSLPKSKSSQRWFYGVQVGRVPGVYTDWPTAQMQINGWKGAKHRKFASEEDAWDFVNGIEAATPGGASVVASTVASTKGDVDSELSLSLSLTEARNGCKVGDNGAKKQKKNNGTAAITMTNGDFEPGTGPLPPDAEDGFDRTIFLNPETGLVERKSEAQLSSRKLQPTGDKRAPLEIYTDGSSRGNGKLGAYAGIGVYFGPQDPRNIADPLEGETQTNQRAELTAIQRAVDIAPIDRDVRIYSDSNYAIKCCTEWWPKWSSKADQCKTSAGKLVENQDIMKTNQWKTSAGKPVENQDIIKPIIQRIQERKDANGKTTFVKVKGHSDNEGNNEADILANLGADKNLAQQRAQGMQL